jgi:hypothetical protein
MSAVESNAPKGTTSGPIADTSEPVTSSPGIKCGWCGRPVTKRGNRFCNRTCSAYWRNSQPQYKQDMAAVRSHITYGPRPDAAERMTRKNPMHNPASVERMRASLTGRTFLSRGGNGHTTEPQRLLAAALGPEWEMELAIPTAPVSESFPSLPPAYKVDIGNPVLRIAVEVDGRSHRSKRWRWLDHRKTEVLSALGWRVLRFTNQAVMADLPGTVRAVRCTT